VQPQVVWAVAVPVTAPAPPGQAVHELWPETAAYVLAAHGTHDPGTPEVPGKHGGKFGAGTTERKL